MDVHELCLFHHHRVHAQIENEFLQRLSDEQVRFRPQGLNSIAWLLWHMARCEDALNVIIENRPQVLDHDRWFDRLQVAHRDVGTGMTDDEVAVLSEGVDLEALRGYYLAVGQRTTEMLKSLRPHTLDEFPELHRLHPDVEGVFREAATWAITDREGKSKCWWLVHLGITHNQMHRGEALTIRGLQGIRNP